jgi:L-fucose isomerase-like protein
MHISRAAGVDASAVIVPDMSGVAYRRLDDFRRLTLPILVITSEFGTVSMWDWEIRDYLRRRDVQTVAPTSLEEYHDICRALAVKERLRNSTMLAYLDNLGAGKQPDIFKRFYWWEEECVDDLQAAFGVNIERRSYRELWARALAIPDSKVDDEVRRISGPVPMVGLATRARQDAVRLKLALSDELDETPGVIAAGINCLNESATSTTTPCLAWNLLFEERELIWGCEADLTSMITQYLTWETLRAPAMMTNLYPFLMGQAALAHERIPYFPTVEQPENHILTAHCGFFGVVPQSWSTEWTLREPVLAIVDDNANVIDARFPEGDLTIVKIASTMDSLAVTPAVLEKYEQYSGSDCLNGAILRVEDGYRYVENLPSHHAVLAIGDISRRLDVVGGLLGLTVERI